MRNAVVLDTPGKKGVTKRQHLNSLRKQMLAAGKSEEDFLALYPEIAPVELRPGSEYLLAIFSAMANARGSGVNGPLPISHTDIKAYCELMQESLTPWEVETLRAMDNAYLDENYKLETAKE